MSSQGRGGRGRGENSRGRSYGIDRRVARGHDHDNEPFPFLAIGGVAANEVEGTVFGKFEHRVPVFEGRNRTRCLAGIEVLRIHLQHRVFIRVVLEHE